MTETKVCSCGQRETVENGDYCLFCETFGPDQPRLRHVGATIWDGKERLGSAGSQGRARQIVVANNLFLRLLVALEPLVAAARWYERRNPIEGGGEYSVRVQGHGLIGALRVVEEYEDLRGEKMEGYGEVEG